MQQSSGEKILVAYGGTSRGKTQVYGAVTKTYYGYRASGDQFMAFRSDVAARPDLLRPVNPNDMPPRPDPFANRQRPVRPLPSGATKPADPYRPPVVGQAPAAAKTPPPPPPPAPPGHAEEEVHIALKAKAVSGLDLEIRKIDFGKSLNKAQARTLYQANVRTLGDALKRGKAGLMSITGIGEKIADTLLEEAGKYTSG